MTQRWLLPFVLALAGCDMTSCGDRVLTSAPSPDGRRFAAVFLRDCGATTGFVTHVTLVVPSEMAGDRSSLFVAEGDSRVISVSWSGPTRLRVTYRAGSAPFRRESEQDGVRIEYREVAGGT